MIAGTDSATGTRRRHILMRTVVIGAVAAVVATLGLEGGAAGAASDSSVNAALLRMEDVSTHLGDGWSVRYPAKGVVPTKPYELSEPAGSCTAVTKPFLPVHYDTVHYADVNGADLTELVNTFSSAREAKAYMATGVASIEQQRTCVGGPIRDRSGKKLFKVARAPDWTKASSLGPDVWVIRHAGRPDGYFARVGTHTVMITSHGHITPKALEAITALALKMLR